MFESVENTPVYPFEYDHLLFDLDTEQQADFKGNEDGGEEVLYNQETYKYY